MEGLLSANSSPAGATFNPLQQEHRHEDDLEEQ
jgi:hypothetical protein